MKGVIKKIDDRGFGFITPEEGGKDIFFHANDVAEGSIDDFNEGDMVSFELGESDKGPKAIDVVLADAA